GESAGYALRGIARVSEKKYGSALVDLAAAALVDPAGLRFDSWGSSDSATVGVGFGSPHSFRPPDDDQIIADCTARISKDRNDLLSHYQRATAYSVKGTHDSAIADFTEVLRLDSNDTQAYVERGHEYSRKKEYDLAIADFDKALRMD